ncbi:MAG: OsmC family protein [Solirubrobacteraceae bacterium]
MTTITPSTIRNGVDTAQVYGTLDALKAQPAAAYFEFRVANNWIDGTHSRSSIHRFWGAGAEDTSRTEPFIVDASEPPVLFGHNEAPNPAEFLLHALAGCLTLTIVNVAAARKVELHEVSSTLTGVLDARGATGLDDSYRNGFERIEVGFTIRGDAPAEKLEEIVERAKARSVVYDMVANGVPVGVTADIG